MRDLIDRLELLEARLRGCRSAVCARIYSVEVKAIIEELEAEIERAERRAEL